MVRYLSTLFLDKPLEGRYEHSFSSNWQIAFLESGKEGNFFH